MVVVGLVSLLPGLKDLDESELLSSQTSEDQSSGGNGGKRGSRSDSGDDEASSRGECRTDGLSEEERLANGEAHQAGSQADSE